MNEAQAAIYTFLAGLALLALLVFLFWLLNGLAVLFTGHPLLVLFEDGNVQVLGRSAGCLLEAWGCAP